MALIGQQEPVLTIRDCELLFASIRGEPVKTDPERVERLKRDGMLDEQSYPTRAALRRLGYERCEE